jgi:hypothetical protein
MHGYSARITVPWWSVLDLYHTLVGGEISHSHHISKGGHAKWFSSQKVDNPQILVLANRKSAFFGGCSIFSYIRVVCLL